MARTLEGVKPGDTIKVLEQYGMSFLLHKVERVTSTRAVCEKAAFMIDSGAQIGTRTTGRWSMTKYGELVNPAKVAELEGQLEIKRRINIAQIHMARAKITADNLEAAEAFIAASQPTKAGA